MTSILIHPFIYSFAAIPPRHLPTSVNFNTCALTEPRTGQGLAPTSKMPVARRFSVTNFFIATSALGFQVFVLYPWHHRLDDDFQKLREEQSRVLKDVERNRKEELDEIRRLIVESKGWGWGKR